MNTDLPPHWVYVSFSAESDDQAHVPIKWVVLNADRREARSIIDVAWREANRMYGNKYTLTDYWLWPNNYKREARSLISQGHCTTYHDLPTAAALATLRSLSVCGT